MSKPCATDPSDSAHWSTLQVWLHWLVVGLLALQFLLQGVMVETMLSVRAGETPSIGGYLLANLHLLSGISIGFLMAYRLYLRLAGRRSKVAPATSSQVPRTLDAPPAASAAVALLSMAATAVHGLFYLLLLTMPLSGLSAWYEIPGASIVHGWQKNVLVFLLLLHVLAALWHLWVLRDGVFQRILRFR